MKILFVVPYVPSLIRVRPYNLIRRLAARGHKVALATVWTNDQEQNELEELRNHCAESRAVHLPARRSLLNCLQALPTGEPLQAHYSWSADLVRELTALVPTVDVVHVEHLRGARYGVAAKRAAMSAGTPVVWDSVDCISGLFEQAIKVRHDRIGRLVSRIELSRTRQYEGSLVWQFDHVLVSSAIDRASLLELSNGGYQGRAHGAHSFTQAPHPKVTVLPNGVDLDYFAPSDVPRDRDTLVFSGKMSYHANESAVTYLIRQVMPRVWVQRPTTRLVVVGKDPSRRLRRLLAGHSSRVTVTGTVADIRPYLCRAAVAAVPLVYGAGCQNKVLEAMACATPVVASPQAFSALKAEAGRDALIAEGDEEFANAVLELLESPHRQRAIGNAGRRYVDAHHRWDRVAAHLEEIYEEVRAQSQHAPRVLAVAGGARALV